MFARLIAALVLVTLGLSVPVFYFTLRKDGGGCPEETLVVAIPRGAGTLRALDLLRDRHLIANRWTALAYLRCVFPGKPLQAGEYGFDKTMGPREVLLKLIRGEVLLHSVTFPEGRTSFEYARILEKAGICSAGDFLAVLRDTTTAPSMHVSGGTLEGLLYPDTYHFPKMYPPKRIVRAILDRFERIAASRREELRRQSLDPYAWVTLASIVEREARVSDEKPVIAGVFFNRLAAGMPLQADPCVLYALEMRGARVDRLTHADLQLDSKYNTYRYGGLPPGPIGNPGLEALDAVLHPRKHHYLYFVARSDGTHAFAVTLADHLRNIARSRRLDPLPHVRINSKSDSLPH